MVGVRTLSRTRLFIWLRVNIDDLMRSAESMSPSVASFLLERTNSLLRIARGGAPLAKYFGLSTFRLAIYYLVSRIVYQDFALLGFSSLFHTYP